jgi:hypothetical protein
MIWKGRGANITDADKQEAKRRKGSQPDRDPKTGCLPVLGLCLLLASTHIIVPVCPREIKGQPPPGITKAEPTMDMNRTELNTRRYNSAQKLSDVSELHNQKRYDPVLLANTSTTPRSEFFDDPVSKLYCQAYAWAGWEFQEGTLHIHMNASLNEPPLRRDIIPLPA